MVTAADFDNDFENKWCPGCGNFGILDSMKQAFANLDMAPNDVLLVSGIGQAAKTPHFLKCNVFHTLHGRALPVATGAKIANHELTIVVNSGDGDCYGEGGGHFMNAIRRNVDITLIVHNNQVYGLTKGQASPTSPIGFVTQAQKNGVITEPFNPLTIALNLGAGFVARGFSNNRQHTTRLIEEGIRHKGISLIDIVQPCITYNRINTHGWYKKRVYDLFEQNYVPDNMENALAMASEWEERIPIGIYYRKEKATFTDRMQKLDSGTLVSMERDPAKMERHLSVE